MRGRSWRSSRFCVGRTLAAFPRDFKTLRAGAPCTFAPRLFRERILLSGGAPVVHRLVERVGDEEQAAAAFLQRAAQSFEQIDDGRKHGTRPLFLRRAVGYAVLTT